MEDIAAATGLSKMTISRVFSGTGSVRKETRERVIEEADRLGYVYNALAGNFSRGKTQLIGFGVRFDGLLGSEYFAGIYRGAQNRLAKEDLRLIPLDTSSREYQNGENLMSLVAQRRVDGVMILAPLEQDELIVNQTFEEAPMVVVGAQPSHSSISWADMDNVHAIECLVDHMVSLGHQKIAYIAGPEQVSDAVTRGRAFIDAIKKHGLELPPEYIANGGFHYSIGRLAAKQILSLDDRPTALIAANDLSALGAMDMIKELGLVPGKDISVAGVDGSYMAGEVTPALTSVVQPLEQLGAIAAELLIEQMQGDTSVVGTQLVRGELKAQESSGNVS